MESDARVSGTFEGAESLRFGGEIEDVSIGTAGHVRQEVSVAVDEAGEQSCAGEIDDFGGFGRMGLNLGGRADFFDAVAFDEDSGVFDVTAGANVEEAGGLDQDNFGRLRFGIGLRQGAVGKKNQRQRKKSESLGHLNDVSITKKGGPQGSDAQSIEAGKDV